MTEHIELNDKKDEKQAYQAGMHRPGESDSLISPWLYRK